MSFTDVVFQIFVNGEMFLITIQEYDLDAPLFTLKDIIYQNTGYYVYTFHITPDDPELDEQLTFKYHKLVSGSRLFCKTFEEIMDQDNN